MLKLASRLNQNKSIIIKLGARQGGLKYRQVTAKICTAFYGGFMGINSVPSTYLRCTFGLTYASGSRFGNVISVAAKCPSCYMKARPRLMYT